MEGMTRKEMMYMEYVAVQDRVNMIRGYAPIAEDGMDAYVSCGRLSRDAAMYSEETIRYKTECARRALESETERQAVEAYYSTDEGREDRRRMEEGFSAVCGMVKDNLRETGKGLDALVKERLGREWGCRITFIDTECACAAVGIEDRTSSVPGAYVQGESFSVYRHRGSRESLEVNCAAAVSVNLSDEGGCSYLRGLAAFASDDGLKDAFRDMLDKATVRDALYARALSDIQHNIARPFSKRDVAMGLDGSITDNV